MPNSLHTVVLFGCCGIYSHSIEVLQIIFATSILLVLVLLSNFIFRISNNWLKYKALGLIRSEKKILFEPKNVTFVKEIKFFLSGKSSWWAILLFVILVYMCGGLYGIYIPEIEFLDVFSISNETAYILVDQRTTNIATIISITLVVTGFLISNIAVKSPIAYHLLFKKSYLYPTVYLTLSTIACFIAVSTIRDSSKNFNYPGAVLSGTYLVFVILILIGNLFRRIIKFADEMEILKMLKEELIIEGKRTLRVNLLKERALTEFNKYVVSVGAEKFDYSAWLDQVSSNLTSASVRISNSDTDTKHIIIKDINIYWIGVCISILKKRGKTIYFDEIILDNIVPAKNIFSMDSGRIPWWGRLIIKASIRYSKIKSLKDETEVYKKFFLERLEEYSQKGRYRELNFVLDALSDLNELQMTYQP